MNKRQARQAAKADMLDALHQITLAWDNLSDQRGLTEQEYQAVRGELAAQLYRWAVRITPPESEPSATDVSDSQPSGDADPIGPL
jgi:hypothetical protein